MSSLTLAQHNGCQSRETYSADSQHLFRNLCLCFCFSDGLMEVLTEWTENMMSPQTHSTVITTKIYWTTTVSWPWYRLLNYNSTPFLFFLYVITTHLQFPPSIWTCFTKRALLLQPLHQQLCGSISWIGILLLWPKYKTAACVPAAALWLAARQHERGGCSVIL